MDRDLRKQAEAQLDNVSRSRTEHELAVHQVELELQNEELRRAQDELERSRQEYMRLYDSAPNGYVTLDQRGAIVRCNSTFADLLNKPAELVQNTEFASHFTEESAAVFRGRLRSLLRARSPKVVYLDVIHTTASHRHVQVDTRKGPEGELELSVTDITELEDARRNVELLLHEKEVLLTEVHHRIKNNMTTVMSLLGLQARSIGDKTARAALDAAHSRIGSMMVLYEKLYRSSNYNAVNLGEYIEDLVQLVNHSYQDAATVSISLNVDDVNVDEKTALPVGVVINELITNSFKHAFPGKAEGTIRVTVKRRGPGMLHAIVCDSGPGFDPERVERGFGLSLIDELVSQMGGTAEFSGPGTCVGFDVKV